MPTFFYDATYIVIFRWLGFGMQELYATVMAASVAAAVLLWWSVALVRRNGAVRASSAAIAWLSAAFAFVAATAAYQLFCFPVTHFLRSYPAVGVALAAVTLLLLVAVVISVWSVVAGVQPDRTTRLLRFARQARLVACVLALICVALLGWSWVDLLKLIAAGRSAAAAGLGG